MNEQTNAIIRTVPAADALRKVPDFDPLRYLTRATSKRTGEKVLKLDLSYKRLWFRLAHPNGKMLFNPLRITDQMAIFEAQIFSDRDDPAPISTFTSTMFAQDAGRQYVQAAQDEALNEALDNAGFGIQLCDVVEMRRDTGYGSEIPLSQVEAAAPAANTAVQPALKPQAEVQTRTVQPAPDAAPSVQPPVVQTETAAPAPVVNTAPAPVEHEPVVNTTAEAAQTEDAAPAPAAEETAAPIEAQTEAAGIGSMLQMLGAVAETQTEAQSDPDAASTAQTEEAQAADETASAVGSYTDDMTVAEICERMTAEEALKVVVTFGTCEGWTLGQVLDKRPSSLRFYVYGSSDAGNVLKAAASILLNDMSQAKAG